MEIDWKKKYNEALEKIKRYTIDKYGCTRLKPADIFPELSENDERIKKAIIDALNSHNNSINVLSSRGYSMDDVISYLEKKEQQEVNCDFYNKELSDIVSAELYKYSGSNSIKSPWALDSTGVQYPLYFANLGAKWQKKQKSVEWNKEDERIRNEILEYFLITRIRDFVANPERQKWISYINRQKESGICWYKSDNKNNPKKPYIDKAGMFYTTDGRMCYASEIENQKEQTEELSTRLNGLMQEYVKSGKDEEEQEHRLKCYRLFWDALEDSEFFKQKEQKPEENSVYPHSLDEAIQLYYYTYGNGKGGFDYLSLPKFQDIVEDFVKSYGQKPVDDKAFEEWVDGWWEEHKDKAYHEVTMDKKEFKNFCRGIRNMYQQKTAEWSEADEKMLKDTIRAIRLAYPYALDDENPRKKNIDWLKSLKNRGNFPQSNTNSPNVWNDEDELMRTAVIQTLETLGGRGTTGMQIDWMKSLPERFSLPPKQEWNEDYNEKDLQTRFAFYTYKDDPSVLYLSNVFVEETSRNHGFGTHILKATEKVAETIGAITIRLKVKQNSSANAWYRKHGYGYIASEDGYDWLEKNLKYMKPNKQEWSEEDKKRLADIFWAIRHCIAYDNKKKKQVCDWFENRLKSLRYQPKQEWSEEDKEILKGFKFICKKLIENPSGEKFCADRIHLEKMLKFLESLSPDSKQEPTCSWKPNKEQMGFLNGLLTMYMTVGQKQQLKSLIGDLKKL